MSDNCVIQIKHLTHFYGERQALREVGFSIYEAEIFGILGPNGGGKTTLFRILSTQLLPSEGTAALHGFDLLHQPDEIRRQIGVVFQSPSLDLKLTVYENLMHQGHLFGMRGKTLERRIHFLLERFKLVDRQGDFAETLSGGMRRRVELAKGLLHQPSILILDEPSTGLDPGARRDLWDHLHALRDEEGVTILLTTHLLDEAEKCDRLAILDKGELVALGSPDQLKAKIGGHLVIMKSSEPVELQRRLKETMRLESTRVDGVVRFEHSGGHKIVPEISERFPDLLESITVGKPTLEDVFIKETGHKFWHET